MTAHRLQVSSQFSIGLALSLALLSGCASTREAMNHPTQKRLDTLVRTVAPCSSTPNVHEWVRVLEPGKRSPDMLVSKQRHVYFSERLIAEASDKVLTMLIAHGISHHELAHLKTRSILQGMQSFGFAIGGAFIPGLDFAQFLTAPIVDAVVGSSQESGADVKALSCLEQMSYTVDDYIEALEFMRTRKYVEKTRYLNAGETHFTSRIKTLRQLDVR